MQSIEHRPRCCRRLKYTAPGGKCGRPEKFHLAAMSLGIPAPEHDVAKQRESEDSNEGFQTADFNFAASFLENAQIQLTLH